MKPIVKEVKRRVMVKRKRKPTKGFVPVEIKLNPTTSALLEAIGEAGMRNRETFDRVIKE